MKSKAQRKSNVTGHNQIDKTIGNVHILLLKFSFFMRLLCIFLWTLCTTPPLTAQKSTHCVYLPHPSKDVYTLCVSPLQQPRFLYIVFFFLWPKIYTLCVFFCPHSPDIYTLCIYFFFSWLSYLHSVYFCTTWNSPENTGI